MANNITIMKNAGVIAKIAAGMFENQLQFCKTIDQADESDLKGMNNFSAGDTIQINKPARYTTSQTADITGAIQDNIEEKVPLVVDIREVVPMQLTSLELAVDINPEAIAERFVKPAVSILAQKVEQRMLSRAITNTFNQVGTPGSTVFDTPTMLAANQKIDEFSCPDMDNRYALLTPAGHSSAVNARKGFFNSQVEVSKQYLKGAMDAGDGLLYYKSNLLPRLTNGNDVTGVALNTVTVVNGTDSIAVSGLTNTTGTVAAGSVFTIAGVNAVDPITKQDLGYLQQFTATATATANGSGVATVSIAPTIYISGSRQNVSGAPTTTASLVFADTASASRFNSLAYHKSAYRMISVPLALPTNGVEFAAQETYNGVTVRIVRQYDIISDAFVTRLDFLGGIAAVRPEWATRITA